MNARGAALIAAGVMGLAVPVVYHYEGEIRHGYRDPIGVITACVGHTATAKLGRRYTAFECEQLLYRDLLEHNDGLLDCVRVPMEPHVHAALLSFAFNVGASKACGSSLIRKLNAGNTVGACAELSRWVYAGGKVLPGLVKRRAAERKLCEGNLPAVPTIPPNLGAIG